MHINYVNSAVVYSSGQIPSDVAQGERGIDLFIPPLSARLTGRRQILSKLMMTLWETAIPPCAAAIITMIVYLTNVRVLV